MEEFIRLEDIESVELKEPTDTIDICVEDNHNFFLDSGALVSNSSKTWSIIQFLVFYLSQSPTPLVVTIGRDTLTDLKDTVLPDLLEILNDFGVDYTHNKSEKHIKFNGHLIRYIGVNDNPNKTHGLKQHISWLNEGLNIDKFTFDQLEQRTELFWIIDLNPSKTESWIYDLADKREDVGHFVTTVMDNPFAPDEVRRKILGYEPTPRNIELGTADAFMWKVYGLGHRADVDNLIFKHWETFEELPEGYDYKFYGLDFGFANDPAAVVEVIIDGHNLYVTELVYGTGLLNGDIAELLTPYLDLDSDILVADSAEPKSLYDLRANYGINAVGAKKGKNSIKEGIKKIKGFKLFINKKSLNLQKELKNYSYKDVSGHLVPRDEYNHAIDALRYALTIHR